mgnify:CR=1 FL=1
MEFYAGVFMRSKTLSLACAVITLMLSVHANRQQKISTRIQLVILTNFSELHDNDPDVMALLASFQIKLVLCT